MLSNRRIIFVATGLFVALVPAATMHRAFVMDRARADEFAVYAAFLARLSHDSRLTTFALADISSKLAAPTPGETWIPRELLPYPPEKAAPPEQFVNFCGSRCGYEFMSRNLHVWRLNPDSNMHFPFDVLPQSSEVTIRKQGKRIVSVTRPGFDFWHNRAVLTYSFFCGSDGTNAQMAVICTQSGDVLLEKVNGKWQVRSYSGLML
jgi:hypothetical protein